VAAQMGDIDKLVAIDQGATASTAAEAWAGLAKTRPAVVFNVVQQLEPLGLNVPTVPQQLEVDPAALVMKADRPAAVPVPSPP
jgi:hypothetical protein